jgi:heat-inducible transcriptional repressor
MRPHHSASGDLLNSDRNRQILAAIIREYIDSAKPVGSRSLARRYGFDLSPATIRNVMADLEEMGYLSQPHPSAGRVPTAKAFRHHVDSILNVRTLTRRERDRIKRNYHPSQLSMTETLKETCRILSDTSNYLGLIITPEVSNMRFKHIQFVRLAPFQVLAIFVTTSGIIQNKRLDTDEDFTQDYLDKITRYLGTILSGLTLVEVRDRILEEMNREKIAYDRLMEKALKLGERALADMDDRELFMEGKVKIFDAPEFSDSEKMKGLLQALEEKSFLLKLLDQSLRTLGVQIVIGSEFDHREMAECSLVTATYGMPGSPRGTLGVIGPMRMNYPRVISLVDYTARLLTQNIFRSGS